MIVSLIAAVARNGVIGADNDMPWRLGTDLRRFRRLTWGKPIVMGRRTFDAIGRALPGRYTVVVTRQGDWRAPGVAVAGGLDEALRRAAAWGEGRAAKGSPPGDRSAVEGLEICVVGGGTIYEQALPRADWLRITHIDAAPRGDVRFPAYDEAAWQTVGAVDTPAGPRDEHATRYRAYRRR